MTDNDTSLEALMTTARGLAGDARETWLQALALQAPEQAAAIRERLATETVVPTQFVPEMLAEPARQSTGSERVGPYRLLSLLGRGGMGDVWLAERADQAYAKQVAVKFVGTGQVSREAVEWFRRERQALARLEHPHIARLLDGGETEDGRPYLVMEYVDGVSIDRFIETLSIEQVMDLFLQVCSAVEYAHHALIVHRDIKPANVLVTADGQCKLLDFGIAKELGAASAGDGNTTTLAYTLHYASPEQMTGQPITVASDVYSLGALLYRLLSGQVVHARDTNPHSQLQRIETSGPDKPSRVLVSGGKDGDRNEQRARRLKGDLDDIVLKCLRHEPAARYGSVRELIDDIQRHQRHEPVLARRGSLGYVGARWLRRHWVGVAAGAAVFLALLGGLLSTQWQARETERQRVLAQKRFDLSRDLVKDVLFDFHDRLAQVAGTIESRKQLVAKTKAYLDKLGADAQDDPDLLADMALVEMRLGDISGHPQFPNLGETENAKTHYRNAVALVGKAVALRPKDARLQIELGKVRAAHALFAYWNDDLDLAETEFLAAIPLLAKALKAKPSKELSWLHDKAVIGLGDVYHWKGKLEQALKTYDSVCDPRIEKLKKDPDYLDSVGVCYARRADTYAWMDRYPEAVREIDLALQVDVQQMRKAPNDNHFAHSYISTQGKRSEILDWAGRPEDALKAISDGLALAKKMAAMDAADVRAARNIGYMLNKRGDVLWAMKRTDQAIVDFEAALQANLDLLKRAPGQNEYQRDVASTRRRLALAYIDADQGPQAAEQLDLALGFYRERHTAAPESVVARRDLAAVLGDRSRAVGDIDRRCAWAAESLGLWRGLQKEGVLVPSDEPQLESMARIHDKGLACDQPGHPGVSESRLIK